MQMAEHDADAGADGGVYVTDCTDRLEKTCEFG